MPKDRRLRSLSSRASPYTCSSKNAPQCNSKVLLPSAGDEKEWEEARCPICMELPHNAVLLKCSSSEKGCRPYMCDTSYRHSNCLDQFRKSSTAAPSAEEDLSSTPNSIDLENQLSSHPNQVGEEQQPKLVCPLCRGQVNGWVVIEPARRFMNSKSRSCALETCDFSGNYSELRKHARLKHPSVCPSKTDPDRQRDWTRLERERDFEDFLSAYPSDFGDDWIGNIILEDHDFMVLEHERDLEDILGTFYSESDDEWLSESINFQVELPPLPLWEMLFPFDPLFETSVPGSSRSVPSYNRIATRSAVNYDTDSDSTSRRDSVLPRGNMQQRL